MGSFVEGFEQMEHGKDVAKDRYYSMIKFCLGTLFDSACRECSCLHKAVVHFSATKKERNVHTLGPVRFLHIDAQTEILIVAAKNFAMPH